MLKFLFMQMEHNFTRGNYQCSYTDSYIVKMTKILLYKFPQKKREKILASTMAPPASLSVGEMSSKSRLNIIITHLINNFIQIIM
ncbi:hypothetical protein Hanom_Chr16g01473641 [Helianthus anomalus]